MIKDPKIGHYREPSDSSGDVEAHAINLAEEVFGQHIGRRAACNDDSPVEHGYFIGDRRGQVQIVENGKNPSAMPSMLSGKPHDDLLMGGIEMACRFIKQQVAGSAILWLRP